MVRERRRFWGICSGFSMMALLFTVTVLSTFQPSAAAAADLTICTGAKTGTYYNAGLQLASKAKGSIEAQVIETKGAVDNIDRMLKGECQAAFVQSDTYAGWKSQNPGESLNFTRLAALYDEYVHLVCNRTSGISALSKLYGTTNRKVLTGLPKSGGEATWFSWVGVKQKDLGSVATDRIGGTQATLAVSDGSEAQCFLFVAGLNTRAIKDVDRSSSDHLALVSVDDDVILKIVDPATKKPVYEAADIPSGTYPNLQPSGTFWGTKPVSTMKVKALLIVRADWGDDAKLQALSTAVMQATPSIRQLVAPVS